MSVLLIMVAVTMSVLIMVGTMSAAAKMAMFSSKMERLASVKKVAIIIVTDFYPK